MILKPKTGGAEGLQPAFKLHLSYREGKAAVTSSEGKLGEYLGSGDGALHGPRLEGAVHWDLYEVVGETRCQTNFAGYIETGDGAKIHFDARGFGMVPDPTAPHRWRDRQYGAIRRRGSPLRLAERCPGPLGRNLRHADLRASLQRVPARQLNQVGPS